MSCAGTRRLWLTASQWFGVQWTGCNAVRELTHLGRKPFTLTFPINPSLDWTTSGRCFTFFLVEVKTSLYDITMAFSDLAIQTEQDDTLNPQPKTFWVSFLILPYTLRSLHSSEQPLLFYFSFLNPSITKCQILSRWVSTTHSSSVVIVTEVTRKCYCWIKTRQLTVTMWLVKHQKLWFYFRLPVVSDYLALSFKMAFKYPPFWKNSWYFFWLMSCNFSEWLTSINAFLSFLYAFLELRSTNSVHNC